MAREHGIRQTNVVPARVSRPVQTHRKAAGSNENLVLTPCLAQVAVPRRPLTLIPSWIYRGRIVSLMMISAGYAVTVSCLSCRIDHS